MGGRIRTGEKNKGSRADEEGSPFGTRRKDAHREPRRQSQRIVGGAEEERLDREKPAENGCRCVSGLKKRKGGTGDG